MSILDRGRMCDATNHICTFQHLISSPRTIILCVVIPFHAHASFQTKNNWSLRTPEQPRGLRPRLSTDRRQCTCHGGVGSSPAQPTDHHPTAAAATTTTAATRQQQPTAVCPCAPSPTWFWPDLPFIFAAATAAASTTAEPTLDGAIPSTAAAAATTASANDADAATKFFFFLQDQ